MLERQDQLNSVLYTVSEILKADGLSDLATLLSNSQITIEQTGYDNWNGGITYYTLSITVDIETFVSIRDQIQSIEATLLEKISIATRHIDNESIVSVIIVPKAQSKIDWSKLAGALTKEKLLEYIHYLKNVMVSVSTGGQRIQDANNEYIAVYGLVNKALNKLNIKNPNSYADLWTWYGKWSASFPTYKERRAYMAEMYDSLIRLLNETEQPEAISATVDLTGWERIERSLNEIRLRQSQATTEEQCQVVGLLSRETIISLAQAVFNKDKHPILDGKEVSQTDAKRMLEAYIAIELQGSSHETLRRYARAALDLANELTHKRTATKKEAVLCASATISMINLIGAIEGRI